MNVLREIYNVSRPVNNYLRHIYKISPRLFTTSAICHRREVIEKTEGKITTVQGKIIPIDHNKQLKFSEHSQACPLCKLGLKVRYTDVLILRQFITPQGDLLPRNITGLCYDQHVQIRKAVEQAKRAGLLSSYRPEENILETRHMTDWKWRKYNVYFKDEDKEPI